MAARTRQALAHRCVAQAQQGGDLSRVLAFAVVQQQDFAAVFWQGGDGLDRGFFLLGMQQAFGGRGRGVGSQGDGDFRGFAVNRAMALRTQVVAGQVAGDFA